MNLKDTYLTSPNISTNVIPNFIGDGGKWYLVSPASLACSVNGQARTITTNQQIWDGINQLDDNPDLVFVNSTIIVKYEVEDSLSLGCTDTLQFTIRNNDNQVTILSANVVQCTHSLQDLQGTYNYNDPSSVTKHSLTYTYNYVNCNILEPQVVTVNNVSPFSSTGLRLPIPFPFPSNDIIYIKELELTIKGSGGYNNHFIDLSNSSPYLTGPAGTVIDPRIKGDFTDFPRIKIILQNAIKSLYPAYDLSDITKIPNVRLAGGFEIVFPVTPNNSLAIGFSQNNNKTYSYKLFNSTTNTLQSYDLTALRLQYIQPYGYINNGSSVQLGNASFFKYPSCGTISINADVNIFTNLNSSVLSTQPFDYYVFPSIGSLTINQTNSPSNAPLSLTCTTGGLVASLANAYPNATYQWYIGDCSSNIIIPTGTTNVLAQFSAGNTYSCKVTIGNCIYCNSIII